MRFLYLIASLNGSSLAISVRSRGDGRLTRHSLRNGKAARYSLLIGWSTNTGSIVTLAGQLWPHNAVPTLIWTQRQCCCAVVCGVSGCVVVDGFVPYKI